MMVDEKPRCLVCDQTSEQIPLLSITYQGKVYAICPQHFPILIHRPSQLVGKLPGAEKLVPHEHDD
jgi:hypothetical protein